MNGTTVAGAILTKTQGFVVQQLNYNVKWDHQFLEADWKMKIAVKTPTNAVTTKAATGKGVGKPKFSRSPFPVAISTLIAAAKPTIANRPSHTSKPLPPFALCSHLIDIPLLALLGYDAFRAKIGEPVMKEFRITAESLLGSIAGNEILAKLEAKTSVQTKQFITCVTAMFEHLIAIFGSFNDDSQRKKREN